MLLLGLQLSSLASASVGFSKTGTVVQGPATCSTSNLGSWGEGATMAGGCFWCATGYQEKTTSVSEVWPSSGKGSLLRAKGSQQVCKDTSFPCNLPPIKAARYKDQKHVYSLVDPATQQETVLGCSQVGDLNGADIYYMNGANVTAPYIVQTDNLNCKSITCTKVSLLDVNRQRSVEVARLLESDAKECTATGACYVLRVIPSPSGTLLAVVLQDDNI
ncbi:hypothetical protein HDU91_004790, partial [Kappamyces sp. JEL0680]